tara:strand:+ start:106 stop:255 length:150 start_codon:yes stop_codon:yes gene_type:complete
MAAYFIWLDTLYFDGTLQGVKGRLAGHHVGFRWIEWGCLTWYKALTLTE